MSQFDILSQSLPRPADTQSARSNSVLPDAPDGSKGGKDESGGFDILLQDLASQTQKQDAVLGLQDNRLIATDEDLLEQMASDWDGLQALLPETSSEPEASDNPNPQTVASVVSLLEGFLPRVLEQAGGSGGADARQEAPSSLLSPQLLAGQDPTDSPQGTGAAGPKMMISVQHQETHFKPIVEGFSPSTDEAKSPAESGLPIKPKSTSSKDLPFNLRGQTGIALASPNYADASKLSTPQANPEGLSVDGFAERMEGRKQLAQEGVKADTGSLPVATLHQIAGAVLEDVKASAAASSPSLSHGNSLNRLTLTRAPEGVLRVLNLQLHPVELGVVTIKMRLAGDSLEMELQTESEETARLLKNDAEKLSSLLKGSGYRPDVITIHSVEAPSHDRSASQRPQQGFQTNDQTSFQQGATGQGGQSQRRGTHQHTHERPGGRRDAPEENIAGSHSHGGVYL